MIEKVKGMSLRDFYVAHKPYSTPARFVNARNRSGFHRPYDYLINHGDLDKIIDDEAKRFATLPGKIEEYSISGIHSPNSTVFELLWENMWNDKANMSDRIWLGRAPNNDIILDHGRVSKSHGYFILIKDEVYYVDNSSRNGTVIVDSKLRRESRVQPAVKTPVYSRISMNIGPFKLTFLSAEDMYRRVLAVVKF